MIDFKVENKESLWHTKTPYKVRGGDSSLEFWGNCWENQKIRKINFFKKMEINDQIEVKQMKINSEQNFKCNRSMSGNNYLEL